jgi:phage FluMu protein Com
MAMSEAIAIDCPHCGKKLKIANMATLRKPIKCPKCAESFEVELEEEGEEETAVAPPPPPKKKKAPEPEPEPAPAKSSGKKKKKKKSDPTPFIVAGVIGAVVLVGGIVVGVVMMNRGSGDGGGAAAKPGEPVNVALAEFNHSSSAFRLQLPSDWKYEEEGKSGNAWVKVTEKSNSIKVAEKVTGGLLGAGGGGKSKDGEERYIAVNELHEIKKKFYAEEEFSSFVEETPINFSTSFGNVAMSVFTAKEGAFGTKIKGFRATCMGAIRQIDIICKGPEKEFDRYKDVYEKVVKSLAVGRKQ